MRRLAALPLIPLSGCILDAPAFDSGGGPSILEFAFGAGALVAVGCLLERFK